MFNQKPQRCLSFAPSFPLYRRLQRRKFVESIRESPSRSKAKNSPETGME